MIDDVFILDFLVVFSFISYLFLGSRPQTGIQEDPVDLHWYEVYKWICCVCDYQIKRPSLSHIIMIYS
jgi:hypothetical protein